MVQWPKETVKIMLEMSKNYSDKPKPKLKATKITHDDYDLWAGYYLDTEQKPLTEEDITYWSSFHRWPLVLAVYLSMGKIPYKLLDGAQMREYCCPPVDTDTVNQREELNKRLSLAKQAVDTGDLVVEKIPDTRVMGHHYVERLVPVRNFIKWARDNYTSNYDILFDRAMITYKSPEHIASGRKKGSSADEIKEKIKARAIEELKAGCLCRSAELSKYLSKLKNRDDTFTYILPSIINDRRLTHFTKAVIDAFKAQGVPLRNISGSTQSRNKNFCKRPGHSA
jgi:hypothetical protein